MKPWYRRIGCPLHPMTIILPTLLIFVVTLLHTSEQWFWPYYEWARTSAQFHEQQIFAGPIAAAAATYYAGRLSARSRIFSQPCSVRVGIPLVWRHIRVCLVAFGSAYLLALIPLVVLTALDTTVDGPDLLAILAALLGFAAITCLGYTIGVVAGGSWPTPLTLVLGFFAMQSTAIDHAKFAAVDPVTHFAASLGRSEALPITSYRIAFFLLLMTTVLMISADRWSRTGKFSWLSSTSVGLSLLVVAGIIVPTIWRPAILTEEINAPAVCEKIASIEYCVHKGHSAELATMKETAIKALKIFGSAPVPVTRIRDMSLAGPGDNRFSEDTIWVRVSPTTSTAYYTVVPLAQQLSGQSECTRKYPPINGGRTPIEQESVAGNLADALTRKAGVEIQTSTSSLDALSANELSQWIAQHQDAIQTCSLTKKQLP